MPATVARYQHRHYKTLIALVFCMTGGTFFLYGVAKLSPVTHITPLRAEAAVPQTTWNQIAIRTQTMGQPAPFYHWRIDPQGRLVSSEAWNNQLDPQADGTIYVVIATPPSNHGVTAKQTRQLSNLLTDLRDNYRISKDHVRTLQ